MKSGETRLALLLVGSVLVLGCGAWWFGTRLRAGIESGAAADGEGSRRPGGGRAGSGGSSRGADDRVRRLTERVDALERSMERWTRAMERSAAAGETGSGASGSGPGSSASGPGGSIDSGGAGLASGAAALEQWLDEPEAREVLLDALEQAEEEQAEGTSVRPGVDAAQAARDDRAVALGLNVTVQQSLDGILADVEDRHADLNRRASELLGGSGSIDDETRDAYRELVTEKRELYTERNERLKGLLGDDGYSAFRRYENDQTRKVDWLESLERPGIGPTQQRNDRRRKDSPPKRQQRSR